jgi:hypothetical protein
MSAVVKPASTITLQFKPFWKYSQQVLDLKVLDAKGLKAWRINEPAVYSLPLVGATDRGGVATRLQGLRHGLGLGIGIRDQPIQQTGFTHTGLPDKPDHWFGEAARANGLNQRVGAC